MMDFKLRRIVAISICSASLTFVSVSFDSVAKTVGEQPSGDTVGGPGTKTEINDSGRHPKKEINPADHQHPRPEPKPIPTPVTSVTTPAVTSASAITPDPWHIDMAALTDLTSLLQMVSENQLNSVPTETSVSRYVGGVGVIMDTLTHSANLMTALQVQKQLKDIEYSMSPGSVVHVGIYVSGPDVRVAKIDKRDAPILKDPTSTYYESTITARGFSGVSNFFKSDEKKNQELRKWFDNLNEETKSNLDKVRVSKGLPSLM